MYRLVDRKNVCDGRRDLIVVGDVNLFSIFWASDENVKAKLKCVKLVVIEDYSHNSTYSLISQIFLLPLFGIKLEWKRFYLQFELLVP